MIYWNIAKLYCQDVLAYLQYDRDKLINFYLLNDNSSLNFPGPKRPWQ